MSELIRRTTSPPTGKESRAGQRGPQRATHRRLVGCASRTALTHPTQEHYKQTKTAGGPDNFGVVRVAGRQEARGRARWIGSRRAPVPTSCGDDRTTRGSSGPPASVRRLGRDPAVPQRWVTTQPTFLQNRPRGPDFWSARPHSPHAPGPSVLPLPRVLQRDVRLVLLVVEVDVERPQVRVQARVLDRQQVRRAPDSLWCECHRPGGVTKAAPGFQSARFASTMFPSWSIFSPIRL